jgi:hypothetical protein
MPRDPAYWRDYRARKAARGAATTLPDLKAVPDLENRLRRDRVPRKEGLTDGERLGDGLPDTAVLFQNIPQEARDAILAGFHLGSPVPFRQYLDRVRRQPTRIRPATVKQDIVDALSPEDQRKMAADPEAFFAFPKKGRR